MKDVTFVSATPIEYQYWLEEMKDLPELKIEWPDAEQVRVESVKVDRPLDYMASMCNARIKNGGDSNFHIFLNSVRGISKIIRQASLVPTDVRVICSKSENAEKRNQYILPEGFTIATATDPVKPINFYTSTCFEGQDIYDKNGRSFIVSDGFTQHTKIDISTSLIQICGRIRDSQYKGHVTQYYATSKYKDVTLEEFSAAIDKNIMEAEQVA